jgi:molybdate transport system substrate-binding protein
MNKHPLLVLCILLTSFLCTACGASSTIGSSSSISSPVILDVFAAASLTKAFNAIATQYHTLYPNVTIRADYDSSSALEQQLANGAPADIFASADTTNMQKAKQAGLVDASQVFARNRLVVILPIANPGHIATLKDLANPGVKVDLAAASVPVGKYARQVLDKMGKSPDYGPAYEDAVLKNVVSQEENDQAIVQKVQLGEVDAGMVYVSDVNSATAAQFKSLAIPDNLNVIAEYPIAAVKASTHISAAQSFIQFVLSSQGQAVLKQFNFIPVRQ